MGNLNLDIYFSEDSEVAEYEALSKGYRIDVYVKIDENVFNLSVYTLIRLQQDFDTECETYGFYTPDPNIIFVKEVKKNEIITTVNRLFEQKFFEKLKPLDRIDVLEMVRIS